MSSTGFESGFESNFDFDCVFVDNTKSGINSASLTEIPETSSASTTEMSDVNSASTNEMPDANSASTNEMPDANSASTTEMTGAQLAEQRREVWQQARARFVRTKGMVVSLQSRGQPIPVELQHQFQQHQTAVYKAKIQAVASVRTLHTEDYMETPRELAAPNETTCQHQRTGQETSRVHSDRQNNARKLPVLDKVTASIDTSTTNLSLFGGLMKITTKPSITSHLTAMTAFIKTYSPPFDRKSRARNRKYHSSLSIHGKILHNAQALFCLAWFVMGFVFMYVPSIREQWFHVTRGEFVKIMIGFSIAIRGVEKLHENNMQRYTRAFFRSCNHMAVCFPQAVMGMSVLWELSPVFGSAFSSVLESAWYQDHRIKVQFTFLVAYWCMLTMLTTRMELAQQDSAAREKAGRKVEQKK